MSYETPLSASPPALAGWVCLALAVVVLCTQLGERALVDPDEGRNSAIALEMAESGDLLVPTLNGLPFLDKPFLFFAAVAGAFRLLGATELAARLPSLLATLMTMGLTMALAARLFGRRHAWIAGLAVATAPLAAVYARIVIFDSWVALFVTLANVAFYRAIESRGDGRGDGRGWTVLAWTAMALGVFTKGPVALLLPLLTALPYALLRRRSAAVLHPAGWLPHLALVGGWLAAVENASPGFLRYALVTETWARLTTDSLRRSGPVWYFLPILLVGTMPWCLAALGSGVGALREAFREAGERAQPLLFMALWLVLPLVFFSLSQSKRPGYVLPLVPAVALLATRSLSTPATRRRAVRFAAAGLLLGALPMLAVGAGWIGDGSRMSAELARLLPSTATAVGAALLAGGLLAMAPARRSWLPVAALALPFALTPLTLGPVAKLVGEQRSSRALSAELESRLEPGSAIVGIEAYSPSLAFYLRRPIILASATGEPLRSNSILAAFHELVARPGSNLRPAGAWREILRACEQPTYFLTQSGQEAERSELAAMGLPPAAENRRNWVAGPCRPTGTHHSSARGAS